MPARKTATKKHAKVTKTTAGKKVKTTNKTDVLMHVNQLKECIVRDYKDLDKLYKKSISETTKKLAAIKKMASKAKQTKTKQKTAAAKKSMAETLQSIKLDIAGLKTEKGSLISEYKKFIAQKKALNAFEKEWSKKNRTPMKAKKQTRSSKKIEKIEHIDVPQATLLDTLST